MWFHGLTDPSLCNSSFNLSRIVIIRSAITRTSFSLNLLRVKMILYCTLYSLILVVACNVIRELIVYSNDMENSCDISVKTHILRFFFQNLKQYYHFFKNFKFFNTFKFLTFLCKFKIKIYSKRSRAYCIASDIKMICYALTKSRKVYNK